MNIKHHIEISALIAITGIILYITGDTKYSFLLLAIAFAYLLTLVIMGIKKGIHNFIMLEQIEVEEDKLQQRFEVESLYRNCEHSDEWLQGFTKGISFFISNYLSDYTIGPDEHRFWELTNAMANENKEPIADEKTYRLFMLTALFDKSEITEEEYDRIGKMAKEENVRKVLSEFPYNRLLINSTKMDAEKELNDKQQNK